MRKEYLSAARLLEAGPSTAIASSTLSECDAARVLSNNDSVAEDLGDCESDDEVVADEDIEEDWM